MSPESQEIKIGLIMSVAVLLVITGFYYSYKKDKVANLASVSKIVSTRASATADKSAPAKTVADKTSAPPAASLSMADVSKHNQPSDCWLVVSRKVYNVTGFLDLHPGGAGAIAPYCGFDATLAFSGAEGGYSHSRYASSLLPPYLVGNLIK